MKKLLVTRSILACTLVVALGASSAKANGPVLLGQARVADDQRKAQEAAAANQKSAQQAAKDKNEKGEMLSKIMGLASIALGGFMIKEGYTQLSAPPCNPGGSCGQAYMQIGMGGMMLLQGLQGLQGAKKAGENAAQAGGNISGLDTLGGAGTFRDGAIGAGVKIDPSLLRDGKVNGAFEKFEKSFGVSRDALANAIDKGADPAKFLSAASGGKLSGADIAKAVSDGNKLSGTSAGAAAMEKSGLNDMAKELKSKLDDGSFSLAGGGGSSRSPASASGKSKFDDLLGKLEADKAGGSASANMQLSPEVQAALEQKELEDRMNGLSEQSIFEVVSRKYKEKFGMLHGQGNGGTASSNEGLSSAGIAGAEGY